ncbi:MULTISPECIES: prephenate dehydratase [Kitasatospora]|uniref:Prephenate dehydratase n=2 Tax=Kitasatospora TaxID=2063 RepID=A0ABT1J784_9ACTN|nr:prephenate dehydratase [Kitasatospora paracochleata]MCP2313296.1 prephenate dehydratase [Kitasatospora paracochleata]
MSATRYTYLGPAGTFTEMALRTLPEAGTRELVPLSSVPAALDAVRNGEAAGAFVAVENSVEGAVTATSDELVNGTPLMIYREVLLPISFALLVRPGTALGDVKTVASHPVAQAQVRRWLATNLPDAQWESASSNAEGARLVQEGRYDAAVAGSFAAPLYGLDVLVDEIHDAADPTTRFILVGRPGRVSSATGSDKTSMVVWLPDDHPGALLELLQEFAVRGINLMRIESRPTGEGMGSYCFLIDCEGHLSERRVSEALMGLKRICPQVRFLGSYPRADKGASSPVRPGTSDDDFAGAADWLSRCLDGRGEI